MAQPRHLSGDTLKSGSQREDGWVPNPKYRALGPIKGILTLKISFIIRFHSPNSKSYPCVDALRNLEPLQV